MSTQWLSTLWCTVGNCDRLSTVVQKVTGRILRLAIGHLRAVLYVVDIVNLFLARQLLCVLLCFGGRRQEAKFRIGNFCDAIFVGYFVPFSSESLTV